MDKRQAFKLLLLASLMLVPNSLKLPGKTLGAGSFGVLVSTASEGTSGGEGLGEELETWSDSPARLPAGRSIDAVARLSLIINLLVDSLIERLNLMVEIVIRSSREESCSISCQEEERSGPASKREERNLSKEFPDIPYLLSSFTNVVAAQGARVELGGASGSEAGESECSVFNINIDKRDLPIAEMGHCCREKRLCYKSCGFDKHHCDSQFEFCMERMCKDKFEHLSLRNGSLTQGQKSARKRRSALRAGSELPPVREVENGEEDDSESDVDEGGGGDDDDDLDQEDHPEPQVEPNLNQPAGPNNHNYNKSNNGTNNVQAKRRTKHGQALNPESMGIKRTAKNRLIDKYKACKLASKLFIIGNLAFGCQAYKQAQLAACCAKNISLAAGDSKPLEAQV